MLPSPLPNSSRFARADFFVGALGGYAQPVTCAHLIQNTPQSPDCHTTEHWAASRISSKITFEDPVVVGNPGMSAEVQRAPLSVYMLADHLDAALAAGEDLVARGQDWRTLAEFGSRTAAFAMAQRNLAEEVRSFELILTARILKSREHARSLAGIDKRFAAIANLFVSGTAILLDAVEECGDARTQDFETGDDVVSYIRSRGLISPEASNVLNPVQLTIDDNFLVAKRLTLGPLMDMAASFLDALATHYDLFVDDTADDNIKTPAALAESSRRERLSLN